MKSIVPGLEPTAYSSHRSVRPQRRGPQPSPKGRWYPLRGLRGRAAPWAGPRAARFHAPLGINYLKQVRTESELKIEEKERTGPVSVTSTVST